MSYVDITAEVIEDFRRFLPAFSDPTKWPEESVLSALEEGDVKTGGSCWGQFVLRSYRSSKRRGMYFYAAHLLASYYGSDGTDRSNVSSEARLNISSQQVGDESVTYRVTEMEPTVTDFISTTIYGVRFLELRRSVTCGIVAV